MYITVELKSLQQFKKMSCRPSSMLNVKSLSKLMSGYMQQEFHLKHYIHYQSVNIVNYGLMPLHEFQLTCCLVISQNYFCVVFTLTLQDLEHCSVD